MKRPVFICLVLYTLAVLTVSLINSLLLTAVVCMSLFIICLKIRRLYKSKAGWLIFVFPLLGLILSYTAVIPRNETIDEIARRGGPVRIEGVVHDAVITPSGMQRLTVFTERISSGGQTHYERLKIQAAPRAEQDGETVSAGSRIYLIGTLWALQPARNPGGFSELYHLGARGYDYTMRVEFWREDGYEFSFRRTLRELRDRVTAVYYASLPEEKAGILSAMVTGDRSGLTDHVRELYRDSGIYHVLVISGMHISIMGLFMDRLLRQFLPVRTAAFTTLFFLCVYCVFTGASTSTVRAVIMAGVFLSSKLFYKEPDLVSSASLAGLIMLIYEPRWIFDIGFQYSFSAVLGLGFFTHPLSHYLREKTAIVKGPKLWLMELVSSSLIIFVATVPVQVYHFNHLITYSIFVNMLVLPLLSFIIVPGFIMGLLGLISPPLAGLLSGLIYFLLAFYEFVSLFAADLPFSRILIASPGYLWAFAFMGILAGLWYLFASEAAPVFKLRTAAAVIILYILFFGIYFTGPRDPIMIKLDVGQGDAVVIERFGEVYIVDGGGWSRGYEPFAEIGRNTGARVIAPYLAHRGIGRVDGIFVSHLHADHVVGAIELMGIVDVARLYMHPLKDRDCPMFILLEEAAVNNGVEKVLLSAGDTFESAEGIRFMVLGPSATVNYESDNEASMILYVDMGLRVMFTGDIGFPSEERLVRRFSNLHTDILKVAHHGSRFSTSDEFLNAIRPRAAIAGVGVHNVFGHPHPSVVSRFYERNIDFYSTNTHGAITINLRSNRITTMLGGPL